MKKVIFGLLSFLVLNTASGQENEETIDKEVKAIPFKIEFLGDNDAAMAGPDDYQANLFFKARDVQPSANVRVQKQIEKTKLKMLAAGIDPLTVQEIEKNKRAQTPVFVSGFNGNGTGGTPPDNSIAVNSKGVVVNVLNSTVAMYNAAGALIAGTSKAMSTFFKGSLVTGQSTSMSNTQCDPKVLFDCEQKRFIVFGMTCVAGDVNSRILVAFSKTEDPTQGWYIYNYKADVYNLGVWFDHPRIGINEFDFFVSGNMFDNNTNQFFQTHIYQIDKIAGYSGATTLKNVAYANIIGNPFTSTFARPGHCATTGNEMHILATSTASNATAFRYHKIVGKAVDMPTKPVITTSTINTSIPYDDGGYALQPNTSVTLKVGDVRGQDAFILNNVLHFVFHYDAGAGYHGLHYNRITKDASGNYKTCVSKKISKANTDYAYASMFNFANDSIGGTSQNTIIGFLESSATVSPGMRAIVVDDAMNLSGVLNVKDGPTFINYQNVGANDTLTNGIVTTRWGDYTGLWRQIAAGTPTVYFAGHIPNTANKWANYVAKLKPYVDYPLSIATEPIVDETKIFPNPATTGNWFIIIPWDKHEAATFDLYDIGGKRVNTLLKDYLNNGDNKFTFSTQSLSPGTYFVTIFTDKKEVTRQQLIIK
jgi:hypothetical protein